MHEDAEGLGIDPESLATIVGIMAELKDSDFERIDPPTGAWAGVQTALSSQLTRTPPSLATGSPTIIEYWIDANDLLTGVGQSWGEFASANHAPALAQNAPKGTLWSYMDRAEVREIWQVLVSRVREMHTEAKVPFRCDAADKRRWFEMTITPEPDQMVHFRSQLLFEEAREPVGLLAPHVQRDSESTPIQLCSWCCRGEHDQHWLDIEEVVQAGRLLEREQPPPLSYGICGACRQEMSAELLVPANADASQG